ncbi:MAG: sugar transferase [Erysipelotrichaceae bacterium]|nr:sugar transferase [Erysipelotrichaceae bacterium]
MEAYVDDIRNTSDEVNNCAFCGKQIQYKPNVSTDFKVNKYHLCRECYEEFYSKDDVKPFYYVFLKRFIDILGGLVGCCFVVVFVIVIKIAYMLDGDFDSVFFVQSRIGKDGKIYKMYKFRSMVPNAEDVLSKLMMDDEDIRNEYLTNKKLENDPRITRIGHFIRKTSIDEFPQFINVLKGEMSLVGPRPYLIREIEDMGFAYNEIIKVKPGITGPWQTGGRSDIPFNERVKIEARYPREASLIGDIKILFKTVSSVLLSKGAI